MDRWGRVGSESRRCFESQLKSRRLPQVHDVTGGDG